MRSQALRTIKSVRFVKDVSLLLLANDPDECPRDKNVEQQRQGVGPDEGDLSTRKGSKLKNFSLML